MDPPSPGSDASKQPEAAKDNSLSRTRGPHRIKNLKFHGPKKDTSSAEVEAGPSNAQPSGPGPHRKENLNAITPSGYGSTKATRQTNAGVSSNQANLSSDTTIRGGDATVDFPHPPVSHLATPCSQQSRASNMTRGTFNSPYRSDVQSRGRSSSGRGGPHTRGTMYRPIPYNRHAFQQALRDANYWEDLHIRVSNLRQEDCNTRAVHALLYDYGQVRHIKVNGHSAFVNLSFHRAALQGPILYRSISNETTLRIDRLGPGQEEDMIEASTIPGKMLKKKTVVPGDGFQFGVLTGERSMMVMHTLQVTPDHPVMFALDLVEEHRKCLDLRFFVSTTPGAPMYRIELRLDSPMSILEVRYENGHKDLIITSRDPPKWYRSVDRSELREAHLSSRTSINDWPRLWKRLTDITLNVERNNTVPVSFVHPDPLIDTGRWLTWKLSFATVCGQSDYEEIIEALKDHNVSVKDIPIFTTTNREEAIIWKILDPHKAIHESDLHEMQDGMSYIRQELRYQLEVCISTGKINEFNMNKDFLRRLGSMDKDDALALLENVADSKCMLFNPMDIFSTNELHRSRKRTVLRGCVLMRTAIITPTTVYVKTPTVEVSNRVIRDNAVAESNFLRVKFQDEEIYGTLRCQDYDNQNEVWTRIDRCLEFGIDIAGRHYAWLACGNSQFREHGAYFFAPYDKERTAPNIRANLGNFLEINEVARCMARIGQCFSTTRAFTNVGSVDVETIDDIERNGYCFSDGVGRISKFLAQMIANQFRIPTSPSHLPAVFQFRMGGCKGILALDPSLKGKTVQVRGSQTKFETPSGGLEIIRVSSFSTSTLNQQLILVLTALGVPKEIFLRKVRSELTQIDAAMTDEKIALTMLTRNVDFNRVTLSIAEMVLDGFLKSDEPFVKSILELWRAWTLKFLKEKARITIEKGAFVFGCVDETNTLRMDEGQLPEIFIQIPNVEEEGKFRTIESVCLLARNPSLHPGDIRVVRAVGCPSLEHLKNVVVLPQQGSRPLANMCSGGDLDGDDYVVIWDEELLSPEKNWNHPAMDYTPSQSVKCDGPVQDKQFRKFFLDYIKHNNLGAIAVNHRAQADVLAGAGGVGNPKCLELAQLHSQAVDFNKTGVPAKLNPALRPAKYPHWIPGKPASRTYLSKEVLGLLFDMVERVKFQPLSENPFDERILTAYELEEEMLEEARVIKVDYDKAIRRIMSQHGIKTEFEIWTAFAMQHARREAWYSFAEEMGLLVGIVKSEFQARVRKHVGLEPTGFAVSDEAFIKLGPFVAAMYTVTAQEAARKTRSKVPDIEEVENDFAFISFPWLFHKELGRIATKRSGPPINNAMSMSLTGEGVRMPKTEAKHETELRDLDIQPLPEWSMEAEGVGEAKSLVGDHVGIPALQPGIEERGGLESASISSVAEEPDLSSSRPMSPGSAEWSETDASGADEQSRSDHDKMATERELEAKSGIGATTETYADGEEEPEERDGSEIEVTGGSSSVVEEGGSGKRSLFDQLDDLMNS